MKFLQCFKTISRKLNNVRFNGSINKNDSMIRTYQSKNKQIYDNTLSKNFKFKNPYDAINSILQEPFYTSVFHPSIEQQKIVDQIFKFEDENYCKFKLSVYNGSQIPDFKLPEVLFLGHSNVGKSSLLHSLLNKTPYVKVKISSKAGHTKALNIFEITKGFSLIDAPGYGFRQPTYLFSLLTEYYGKRAKESLKHSFLLICSKAGLTDTDKKMIAFLEAKKINYALIITKIDDKSPYHIYLELKKIKDFIATSKSVHCFPQVFLTSSATGEGIGIIQAFIADITKLNLSPKKETKTPW